MAEKAVVDVRRMVPLPEDADVEKIAAAMHPAMSSWVALRRRVPIKPGQSVLVLGATGNAGTMAVQIAKRLGAGRVVGAGRDAGRLEALTTVGADDSYLAELPSLIDKIDSGALKIGARTVPLRDVESVWAGPDVSGERTVIIPQSLHVAAGPSLVTRPPGSQEAGVREGVIACVAWVSTSAETAPVPPNRKAR